MKAVLLLNPNEQKNTESVIKLLARDGIGEFIIFSYNYKKNQALITYYLSLLFNFCWSFIFFSFRQYLFAFIWLLVLLILVIIYTIKYFKINKTASYLNIPYVLWLVFAGILNLSVYLLN